ncbi:MAG: hypothetical protein WC364_14050 [Eubacteriales bacterium]|jgi:hypothetical protein
MIDSIPFKVDVEPPIRAKKNECDKMYAFFSHSVLLQKLRAKNNLTSLQISGKHKKFVKTKKNNLLRQMVVTPVKS